MIYENIYKKKDKIKFIQKKNVFVPNQTTKLILKLSTRSSIKSSSNNSFSTR